MISHMSEKMSLHLRIPRLWVLVLVVLVAIGNGVAHGQAETTEAQESEIVSLATVVGAALQGQIVPTDEPFGWANDFLKSSEQTTFVPFTISVDTGKLSTSRVAMYLFVVPQGVGVQPGADGTDLEFPDPVFEDGYHLSLGAPTEEGVYEIRRGFWVPAGDYDAYVALSESDVADGAEPTTMMLKKTLSVPDLWTGQLATSSVILADRIESLTAPPPPDQLIANPYTLGMMRIVPKSVPVFLTDEEFSLVMLVYNPEVDPRGMPDVSVDYTFNTRMAGGLEFFNRTNPQTFNQQTLPQGFDLRAGHQLVAGQAIPLSSFPAAEYRLDITVTDNSSGVSLTRIVDFSVAEF